MYGTRAGSRSIEDRIVIFRLRKEHYQYHASRGSVHTPTRGLTAAHCERCFTWTIWHYGGINYQCRRRKPTTSHFESLLDTFRILFSKITEWYCRCLLGTTSYYIGKFVRPIALPPNIWNRTMWLDGELLVKLVHIPTFWDPSRCISCTTKYASGWTATMDSSFQKWGTLTCQIVIPVNTIRQSQVESIWILIAFDNICLSSSVAVHLSSTMFSLV